MNFCPPYPRPHKNKSSFLLRFLRGWKSWLHVLFERSYSMKMGHVSQPGMDLYMMNDPEWVQKILSDPAGYPKHHLMHRMLEPLLGSSIFTTNGKVWERQRSLVSHAFAQARLKLVFRLMAESVADMAGRMDAVADGRSFEVDGEMTHVTADIIFRTILSERLDTGTAQEIYEAFNAFQRLAQRAMILMIYRLPVAWATRASEKPARRIRAVIQDLIARRLRDREQGLPVPGDDILAGLLEARDADGVGFTYEELVDQVCMLFLAGHETSASALTWSLYLLSHSPALQERILAESAEATGGRDFQQGDMKSLPTVANLFREALRLYPPVGFFVREAAQAQCMRDKAVAQGSPILISPWLLHRHRELWERPDEFDPDRFETEAGRQSVKCAYMPFSKGPRVCIGAAFATQEAILILATMVRRYRIEPDLDHVPEPVGRVTVRPRNGVRIRLVRRGGGA
ncbi:MAG: cytochrome P450 [Noviherbaspirillum sp.]